MGVKMPDMTDLLWWVQLADCSYFNKWEEMRDVLNEFPLPEGAALGCDWTCDTPGSISILGSGMPMELDDLFLCWKPLLGTNEYIVMVEMQRTDVLRRYASKWYVLTSNHYTEVIGTDVAKYLLASAADWDGIS
jgi:hypothetical protein